VQAELVTFRVLHRDRPRPAAGVLVYDLRVGREQTLGLGRFVILVDAHVEMVTQGMPTALRS
jgi:hypothetical protein